MDEVPKIDSNRDVVLVDIDGTLANLDHRLHLIGGVRKKNETPEERRARKSATNWRKFFAACDKDVPIEFVCQWVRNLPPEYDVVCVSGRSDECREKTERWLRDQSIPFRALFMRKAGDYRQDDVVKEEILKSLPFPMERIAFVLDDRDRVVAMWRRNGLTVYQVAEGAF